MNGFDAASRVLRDALRPASFRRPLRKSAQAAACCGTNRSAGSPSTTPHKTTIDTPFDLAC
jgi:hypothetical protein